MFFGSSIASNIGRFVLQQTRGIKTHSATKKRWRPTGNGGFKRGHAGAAHGLYKKASSRLRGLRQSGHANPTQKAHLRRLLPNG